MICNCSMAGTMACEICQGKNITQLEKWRIIMEENKIEMGIDLAIDVPKVVSVPVKVYRSYLKCPKCEYGNMLYDNRGCIDLAVYPPVYFHKCDKCGYYSTYTQKYPFIKFEDI